MIQMLAAGLAGLLMLFAALRGLLPGARLAQRLYTLAVGGWSAFGAALYFPAVYGRFAPVGLAHSHPLVTLFGFGLIALAVYGASISIGDR